MIGRFIAGKFRNPTGFFGRLVGRIMAQSNEPAAKWTVSLLDIQPNSRVLEVGFGSGVAIDYAVQKAVNGLVMGIDSSETMVRVASHRNAAAIEAGIAELKYGKVSSLPYPDDTFDRVFTIHCIYFWANSIEDLKGLYRVLKPNGLLAVTIKPKDKWNSPPPPDLFSLYHPDEIVQMLSEIGFQHVRIENYPQPDRFPGECVLGVK
jgi:ubiquinone/menaquinone biosynthesis C-methylase UbiE